MNIVQVGWSVDADLRDPDALLDRYATLTGWGEALLDAGADRVAAVHRFSRDADFTRNGVRYIFRAAGMAAAAAAIAPDVVHVNGLNVPIRTSLLRRALPRRTAVAMQDHATGAPRTHPWPWRSLRDRARRILLRDVDAFFFTAESQADEWRRRRFIRPGQRVYGLLESSTRMRPIDRAEAKRASGVDGSPALLWVGRLNGNKDPLTVLDGFARTLDDCPAATLTFVFVDDDLLSDVAARLRASPHMASRVRIVGTVPHAALAAYYSAADLFVLGSHHEGSGYALLEACACGAVPVVTDIPAFRAITGGGAIGALWPAGDAAGFAAAVRRVIADLPAQRARTIERFHDALSWRAVGRAALSAYQDLVARRQAASTGMVN